jgi:hypothetical protein
MSLRLAALFKGVVPLLKTHVARPLWASWTPQPGGNWGSLWPTGFTLSPRALLEAAVLRVSTYWRKRTKLRKHKRKQRMKKIGRKSLRKQALKGRK